MSPLHARPALLPLMLSAGVLAACGDRSPIAPEVPVPVPAAVISPPLSLESAPGEAEDIADLLFRVAPSIGDTPGMNALTVHLRRLQELAASDAAADTRKHADVTLKLLEAVERADKGEASADLGVIRLVLENRR